jgi:hypothetical protein
MRSIAIVRSLTGFPSYELLNGELPRKRYGGIGVGIANKMLGECSPFWNDEAKALATYNIGRETVSCAGEKTRL